MTAPLFPPVADPRPVRSIDPCRCGGAVVWWIGQTLGQALRAHRAGRLHTAWAKGAKR